MSGLKTSDDPTLAGRYLADQLTPEECLQYESALRSDAEVLAELEATARLKIGLARLRETGQLERLLKGSARWTLSRVLPLVAGLAAMAIGLVLWRSTAPPADSPGWLAGSPALLSSHAGGLLPVTTVVAVFRKRSGGAETQVMVPEGPGAVELRVLPTRAVSSARYRLRLARVGDDNSGRRLVGTVEGLTPAADGFVTAYADASYLSAGKYKVMVSSMGLRGKPASEEEFEIELARRAQH